MATRWLRLCALMIAGCGSAGVDPVRSPMTDAPDRDLVRAERDPTLRARVVSRHPLLYEAGVDAASGRPAHVRAGSALVWLPDPALGERPRLGVIQDDALFLALVNPETGSVSSHPLPPGYAGARLFDDASGNKAHKLDLEAAVMLNGTLYAFGSGSTDARELVVSIRGFDRAELDARVVHAAGLYATLRSERRFSGSELNLEGAARVGSEVLLVQRGNGRARGDLQPLDAITRVDAARLVEYLEAVGSEPPPLKAITRYELGSIEGVRLTFTDVATRAQSQLFFLAAAEASPDTVRDGVVVGTALGVIEGARARLAPITDEHGAPFSAKAEGLALDPHDPSRAWVVLDRDDPGLPAELCELRLHGF